jgi:phage tail-like protein
MTLPDLDTSVGYSFGHEIDGVVTTQTQEVYGRKSEQDVIELKQNTSDGKHVIKKMPGGPNAVEATLARGLTAESSFEKWVNDLLPGVAGQA